MAQLRIRVKKYHYLTVIKRIYLAGLLEQLIIISRVYSPVRKTIIMSVLTKGKRF